MKKSLAAHYSQLWADQGNTLAQFKCGLIVHRDDGITMNMYDVLVHSHDWISLNKSISVQKAAVESAIEFRSNRTKIQQKAIVYTQSPDITGKESGHFTNRCIDL
jgi:hypothetical protein